MRWRSRDFKLVDPKTGQELSAGITLWTETQEGRWVRIFLDGKAAVLARHPKLRGESYKVLHYIETKVGWHNLVPSPSRLATGIGMKEENVYRAYAELIKAECIYKKDGQYYLSPYVGWVGKPKDYQEACEAMPALEIRLPMRQLAEGRAKYG